ncbi:hypothetical protein QA640_42620 [Bradyrhizobium sp. CB82]|uniref:hypothetical protein n=1 Tax=Bradyrhizobium sp. CB82 TaxID=3039159 RepID=UPI0024B1AC86|nr:hypothetical protein [Bradyrhizobium sp. CB82]WFU40778.1 hypothetical protein QA640_42620 [Bradyrhizobium sp. CB82]
MQDIDVRLRAKGIRQEDFRAICAILLSRGLLTRADGGDALRLYDVAARCEAEISEYLSYAFPVVLTNATRPPHFRLVPSRHGTVGLPDPEDDLEARREIRPAVFQALAVALLGLRMLYDDQLLEKRVDSAGRITVKLTDFVLFLNTTFGFGLPATTTDRRALFMKLKKHGAIDIRIDELGDEDAVIVIRPEILTLVLDQNIRNAQATFEQSRKPAGHVEPQPIASATIIPLERS